MTIIYKLSFYHYFITDFKWHDDFFSCYFGISNLRDPNLFLFLFRFDQFLPF